VCFCTPVGFRRNPCTCLGINGGRDQNRSIWVWKNIGCLSEHEVVQGSWISYDRLHLQAELPVRVAIPLDFFQCVFQFDGPY
jgi:hypothetical protein